MNKIITNSCEETIALGYKFGSLLKGNEVIILNGDLACGKTTFTKGIAKALGITSNITSPTFVICKEYNGKYSLNHLDLYRLDELGFDYNLMDYYQNGVTIIEWPFNVKDMIPQDYIQINFKYLSDNSRELEFIATNKDLEMIINATFTA